MSGKYRVKHDVSQREVDHAWRDVYRPTGGDEVNKHTPGPWRWWFRMGLPSCLAANHGDRPIVMDFARLGMNGAQPRFRVDGRMLKASEIDNPSLHPDAVLMAAAPDLVEALVFARQFVVLAAEQRLNGALNTLEFVDAALAKARGEA